MGAQPRGGFSHGAIRHAAVVKIRTGVKRDGTLVARQVETVYDNGAYAITGPSTTENGGKVSGGPYRIPHQELDDVLRVHEHAADRTLPRVRRAAGLLGLRVADGRHRAAPGDRSGRAAA